MRPRILIQAIVLGAFLVLAGLLLLLQTYTGLNAWAWFALFALGGAAALALFAADPSDRAMLITAYASFAIALMLALIMLNVLREEAVAVYALVAVALPFLVIYVRLRHQWWTLIPAYVLLAVALMIALLGLGILDDALVPAYVLFAIAIPFFAVYAWDRRRWWAIIPAGIMAALGLFFLAAEAALEWLVPVLLLMAGIWILARLIARRRRFRRPAGLQLDRPERDRPEWDRSGDWKEE